MSERRAFLRSIASRPDDDAPALIYADWLEEHEESARAEYIRLSTAAERMDEDDPQRSELASKAFAIFAANADTWNVEGPKKQPRRGLGGIRRGMFGTYVVTDLHAFLGQLPWLLDHHPIGQIKLCGLGGSAESDVSLFADSPLLEQLHDFWTFDPSYGSADLTSRLAVPLLSSRRWGPLRNLFLYENRVGARGASAIAANPALANLIRLNLQGNAIRDSGLKALMTSRCLPALKSIGLRNSRFTPAGLKAIHDPTLPALEAINLGANGLADAQLVELISAPIFGRLTELELADNRAITGVGLRALADSPRSRGLKKLAIHGTKIDAGDLAALGDSPHLDGLEELAMDDVLATEVGALVLLRSKHLRSLRTLILVHPDSMAGGSVPSERLGEVMARFPVIQWTHRHSGFDPVFTSEDSDLEPEMDAPGDGMEWVLDNGVGEN